VSAWLQFRATYFFKWGFRDLWCYNRFSYW